MSLHPLSEKPSLEQPPLSNVIFFPERIARSPEKRRAANQIMAALLEIEEQKGRPGVETILALLKEKGSATTPEDLQKTLEQVGDLRDLEAEVLKFLEDKGITELGPKGEIIIDLDKFKLGGILTALHGRRSTLQRSKLRPYTEHGQSSLLYFTLRDIQVISRDDWEKGERETKPLFYTPDSPDDALDIEKIRASRFYLGLWQVGHVQNYTTAEHPVRQGHLKMNEAALACLLYHPQFGDGRRDQATGQFLVRYADGQFRPISTKWFEEVNFQGGSANYTVSMDTPRRYLTELAPHILERGLLKLDDFRILASYAPAKKLTVNRARISDSGVLIDGIRYFLGRDLARVSKQGSLRVHKISATLSGITKRNEQGEEELIYLFHLTNKDDLRLKPVREGRDSNVTRYFQAPKEVADPRRYSPENFQQCRPGESLDDYQQRLKEVDDFKFLLKLGADLSRRAHIDLTQLNASEQQWAIASARALKENYPAILDLAEKYGLSGLKSFLALEHSGAMGGRALAIAENLDRETALAVFDKYFEVVDAGEKVRGYLEEYVGEAGDGKTIEAIFNNLLRRAKQVLVDFSQETQKAKLQKRKTTRQDIFRHLEDIQTEILLFASTFKALAAEQAIDLRDIKDTDIQITDAASLRHEDKEIMKRIFAQNRPRYSKPLLKKTLAEFSNALESAGSKFYLLRHQGDLAAFVRFDKLPNGHLYAGSLNVRPEIKGSVIGSAMLKAALEDEGRERVVEAVVYEKNPMMKHYVDDFGFKIVGEIPDYQGTGEKFYKLERSPVR